MLIKCPKCISDAWRYSELPNCAPVIECLNCGHTAEGKTFLQARQNWYDLPGGVVYILAKDYLDAKDHAELKLNFLPGDYIFITRASQIPTQGSPVFSASKEAYSKEINNVFLKLLRRAGGVEYGRNARINLAGCL